MSDRYGSDGSDDSFIDDDEEEEQYSKKRKRPEPNGKMRKKMKQFIDDEAGEDDDKVYSDEDRVEDEFDIQRKKLIAEQDRRRREYDFFANHSPEEISRAIEERHMGHVRKQTYHASDDFDDDDEDEREVYQQPIAEVDQQSLLPDFRDPKMWSVRVKKGSAKLVIWSIMNKAIHMKRSGLTFNLLSAVATNNDEYVYLEAETERAVIDVIQDLALIQHYTLKMIPIANRASVLDVKATSKDLEKNQWVRISRGMHKGDLAKVIEVFEGGTRAVIQLIPRLDREAWALKYATSATVDRKKKRSIPKQEFFNAEEVSRKFGEVSRKKFPSTGQPADFFDGNYYMNGYLIKEVKVSTMLKTDGIKPTIEELQLFSSRLSNRDDNEEQDHAVHSNIIDELAEMTNNGNDEKAVTLAVPQFRLRKGEKVRVIEGDQQGMIGTVVSVDEKIGVCKVKSLSPELAGQIIEFHINELARHIEIGKHVRVVHGVHSGETGTVVNIREDDGDLFAIILTDVTIKEIQVQVTQIQESVEVAPGLNSLGGYELFDLVELGHSEVGIITNVNRDSLQILNNLGLPKKVRPAEIRCKRNSQSLRSIALDSQQNQIKVGDFVNIIKDEHFKKSGTIKALHQTYAFIQCPTVLVNAGIIVARARSCLLPGSRSQSSVVIKPSQNYLANKNRSRGHQQDEFQKKTVKIKKGQYKGYIGVVISAADAYLRVELHSKHKQVVVPKVDAKIVGDEEGSVQGQRPTGFHKLHTLFSSDGAQSNFRTPAYTPATPRADVPQTPSHESSVWRPIETDIDDRLRSDYAPKSPGTPFDNSAYGGSISSPAHSLQSSWRPSTDEVSLRSSTNSPSTPIDDENSSKWSWVSGIVVKFQGNEAIVCDSSDPSKLKILLKDKKRITVSCNEVSIVPPQKDDKCHFLFGSERGNNGNVIEIDDTDIIVSTETSPAFVVEIDCLAKLVEL